MPKGIAVERDPSFDGYLAAQEGNLQQIRRLPQFRFLEALHALYERSITVVSLDPHFYVLQLLLVCHQALLSAAATTARALPRDTIGVTRRAIEAACLARAIKHDEKNLERWLAFDKRMSRWGDRQKGVKPKAQVQTDIVYPPNHPVVESLRSKLGTLSDAGVHLTPEFMSSHAYQVRKHEDGPGASVEFPYFEPSQPELERSMLYLGAVHLQIIDLFVECFDGAFHRDAEWCRIREAVGRLGQSLATPPPRETADEESSS